MDINIDYTPVAYASPVPVASAQIAQISSEKSFFLPNAKSSGIDENQIARLEEQGFTAGLARALADSVATFPLRIWVVDNSGSMATVDGHRFVETSNRNNVKVVSCTRWREIQETVEYHVQMAALLKAPTIFRMLNDPGAHAGPSQFGVADKGDAYIAQDLQVAMKVIKNATPGGVTPLARHIREIRENISALAPSLIQRGQKVAVILATDGLPTDDNGVSNDYFKRDFVEAIRSLEGLPMWIVVRLCTDDEEVVNFYNDLDSQLELSVEVLDDFIEEAKEVHEQNAWLNYSLPLHRCREMGFHNRLMDLLDERQLTKGELRDFGLLLFGKDHFDGVADPEANFKGFRRSIERIQSKAENQWNPIKKRVLPWVDSKKMKKIYGGRRWSMFK